MQNIKYVFLYVLLLGLIGCASPFTHPWVNDEAQIWDEEVEHTLNQTIEELYQDHKFAAFVLTDTQLRTTEEEEEQFLAYSEQYGFGEGTRMLALVYNSTQEMFTYWGMSYTAGLMWEWFESYGDEEDAQIQGVLNTEMRRILNDSYHNPQERVVQVLDLIRGYWP